MLEKIVPLPIFGFVDCKIYKMCPNPLIDVTSLWKMSGPNYRLPAIFILEKSTKT
jgi:hypothetical protein